MAFNRNNIRLKEFSRMNMGFAFGYTFFSMTFPEANLIAVTLGSIPGLAAAYAQYCLDNGSNGTSLRTLISFLDSNVTNLSIYAAITAGLPNLLKLMVPGPERVTSILTLALGVIADRIAARIPAVGVQAAPVGAVGLATLSRSTDFPSGRS